MLHTKIAIAITPKMIEDRVANLEFQFLNPVTPKDIDMGEDMRMLSIGLISAVFE